MELEDIVKSVDIAEYIGQYVELDEKGGELWGLSPFQPERTPSFSVRRETGQFYDFSSGKGGNIINFIAYYHHVSNGQAVKILKQYAGIDDNGEDWHDTRKKMAATLVCSKYAAKKREQKPSSVKALSPNYMERYENKPDKLQIWRDEGISDESMRFFDVKYDSFSNCIVYPIKDLNGNIVNIGGRTLDPDFKAKGIRKYTYFKSWGQLAVIFGLFENMEYIKMCREVILFEGMKSVLLARDYGFYNCGAILTSHLNPQQKIILAKLGVDVVFALDKEIDVREDKNIMSLKRYANVYYLYDFKNLLGEKDAPVDKGAQVFGTLYNDYKYKL